MKAPIWEGVARGVLAWALSREGRDSEAISVAQEADRMIWSNDVFAPMLGCLATDVYLRAGLTDRAATVTDQLEGLMESLGEHFYAGEVLRARARVLHARGERARAVSVAEQALDHATARRARALAVVAATTSASMTEDRVLLADHLRSSLGLLVGRRDVPYVRDAMKLLDVM